MNDRLNDIATDLSDPTEWVDRHGDVLFRYATTRVGDRHLAEDLVQETFVAALRSKDFSGQADERTWFVGILKHKIADHFRRLARERAEDGAPSSGRLEEQLFDEQGWWRVPPTNWPAARVDACDRYDFWETFRHCMEGLPQRLRTVFSLREVDDRSTQELCEMLGVSPGNLSVLLYRARMALRRCLEVRWFDADTDEG